MSSCYTNALLVGLFGDSESLKWLSGYSGGYYVLYTVVNGFIKKTMESKDSS